MDNQRNANNEPKWLFASQTAWVFRPDASPPQTSALDTSDDPRVDIVMDPLVKSSTSLQRAPQSSASNRSMFTAALMKIAALESSSGSVNFEFP